MTASEELTGQDMEWSRVRWDGDGKAKDEIKKVKVGSCPEILDR